MSSTIDRFGPIMEASDKMNNILCVWNNELGEFYDQITSMRRKAEPRKSILLIFNDTNSLEMVASALKNQNCLHISREWIEQAKKESDIRLESETNDLWLVLVSRMEQMIHKMPKIYSFINQIVVHGIGEKKEEIIEQMKLMSNGNLHVLFVINKEIDAVQVRDLERTTGSTFLPIPRTFFKLINTNGCVDLAEGEVARLSSWIGQRLMEKTARKHCEDRLEIEFNKDQLDSLLEAWRHGTLPVVHFKLMDLFRFSKELKITEVTKMCIQRFKTFETNMNTVRNSDKIVFNISNKYVVVDKKEMLKTDTSFLRLFWSKNFCTDSNGKPYIDGPTEELEFVMDAHNRKCWKLPEEKKRLTEIRNTSKFYGFEELEKACMDKLGVSTTTVNIPNEHGIQLVNEQIDVEEEAKRNTNVQTDEGSTMTASRKRPAPDDIGTLQPRSSWLNIFPWK